MGGGKNNLNNASSKHVAIVLGIFALVIVTTAASFAFFTYSRTGQTTTTITSGDLEFSFIEGENASLANAFPVSDEIGANDTTEEYTFAVSLKSSSQKVEAYYNVLLLDDNKEANVNYFTNDQIKFALIKNDVFVAETTGNVGRKLSTISGFTAGESQGEGVVLESQLITANTTDNYKLRIWISDDVNYSNTELTGDNTDEENDAETSVGKYNGYKYSLKVKITTEAELSHGYSPVDIELDPNGGTVSSTTITINEFGKYTTLPNPTREGYIFAGWYTEDDKFVDVNTKYEDVKANKLIAKWNIGKYTLTVNPNGGTYTTRTNTYEYIMNYGTTQNINEPTRVGYTFKDWTLNGSNSKIENGIFTMGNANATLTANWDKVSYKLTVNPNGGTWNNSTSNQTFDMDYLTSKQIPNPTRDGYIFTGWKVTGTNSQLSSTSFTIGNSNATLEATWQVNTYPYITMHYKQNVNANGYTLVEGDTEEKDAAFGSTVTPSTKTYTGFTAPTPKSLTISSTILDNVVEYQYGRNKYNLTINPNGGKYNNTTDNTVKEMLYESTLKIDTPTKDGYTFTGWTVSSGELNDNIFKISDSDATLTANYEIKKFLITFDANGGSTDVTYKEITYGSTYGELPTPQRNGYGFLGWYTSEDSEEEITAETSFTANTHQTLYAKWKEYLNIKATDYVMSLAETNTHELRIDEHAATGQQDFATTEYRYWGTTPNNYVQFNNELWRIIGVFDVDDGSAGIDTTGNVEKRLKIMRNSSLGTLGWDNSASNVNNGSGVNEWSQTKLMTLLNTGAYYNRTTGTCYAGPSTGTKNCDFTSNGLTDEAKGMIADAKWYLGSVNQGEKLITSQFYTGERSNNLAKQCSSSSKYCNDSVTRTKSWIGKVGLIYPSDFGYASDVSQTSSLPLNVYKAALKTSWIGSISTGTITPYTTSASNFIAIDNDYSTSNTITGTYMRPVVYLDSDVLIYYGNGTSSQPFVIGK